MTRNLTQPAARAMLAIVAAAIVQPAAKAQEAPSFPAVFMQAERSSPRLVELQSAVLAAEGAAREAKAWPTPTVGFEREDFGGTGLYRGGRAAQTTIMITEPFELAGQRGARIAAGDATVAAAETRHALLRAEFGFELAAAYADAEAAANRVRLLTEDLDRAREDVRSARALVDAGREGQLRAVQAQAAASGAEADLEAARADATAALARLSTLAGVAEPYSGVQPLLLNRARPEQPAAAPTPGQPPIAPLVATAEAERESAARRLTVAQKQALPVPAFSLGRRRIAGDDADVWVAGISVPLPLRERNRGHIAVAQAELTAAEARLDAARLQANAERRVAAEQLAAATTRLASAEQGEASASDAYRLARIGYDAGRTPLYELQATRRALTEAQLRSLDARHARVLAEASLARLAGRIPFID
jgi:outer membrane protein, heavy metal efflux system